MRRKLAQRATQLLLESGKIEPDQEDLFKYGIYLLISKCIYITFICIASAVLEIFFSGLVFCISFESIRKYAGGYHADTEFKCNIFSAILISASILFLKLGLMLYTDSVTEVIILSIIFILTSVVIIIKAPVDTEEKPLDKEEMKRYKLISIFLVALNAAVFIISLIVTKISFLKIPICIGFFMESILLIIGGIKRSHIELKEIE